MTAFHMDISSDSVSPDRDGPCGFVRSPERIAICFRLSKSENSCVTRASDYEII